MAKLHGPLFSLKASGSIGPVLTYSERKTGSQVRYQRKQSVPIPSWSQCDNQSLYRIAYARWLSFTDEQKQAYADEATAKNLPMSGWNYFMKSAMADPYVHLGLCGYWSMNREGYGTLLDLSKQENTGILSPSYPSNCPIYVAGKNAKMHKAIRFDGINDTVLCGSGSALDNLQNFSFTAWVKKLSTATTRSIVDGKDLGGGGWYVEFDTPSGSFQRLYSLVRCVTSPATCYSSWSFPLYEWVHFCMVFNNTTKLISLYINGVYSVASPVAGVGARKTDAVYNLCLGARYTGGASWDRHLYADMDEVAVFNRVLSVAEIQDLYNMFA